ncbi:RNA 2',3'-cyclic phosphodiesterase [Tessaracoccus lapidicaptus]|uniref:RNA 2',3'-cyclic phosphodiesterase n=1 Tax=Tessaracoccus lapidicaptus TaxID=1427523 RepID=UPI00334030F9
MGARMFTAVLPPAPAVAELDALLEPRRGADPTLRWTRPEGWHVTTSFMADVPAASLERLEENLAEVAQRAHPFVIRLAGGLALPHAGRARILALGVPEGHDELAALSSSCRGAASRAGAEADGARFVGHLTLARHNRGLTAVRWLEILDSFPGWRWTADELCLVESHPGARYEVVSRFPLGGAVGRHLD